MAKGYPTKAVLQTARTRTLTLFLLGFFFASPLPGLAVVEGLTLAFSALRGAVAFGEATFGVATFGVVAFGAVAFGAVAFGAGADAGFFDGGERVGLVRGFLDAVPALGVPVGVGFSGVVVDEGFSEGNEGLERACCSLGGVNAFVTGADASGSVVGEGLAIAIGCCSTGGVRATAVVSRS